MEFGPEERHHVDRTEFERILKAEAQLVRARCAYSTSGPYPELSGVRHGNRSSGCVGESGRELALQSHSTLETAFP